MSKWIIVDVESDGPAPGIDMYSMISFGAVVLDTKLDKTFKGLTAPISDLWNPAALAISNITREEHMTYPRPMETMKKFDAWLKELNDQVVLVSDNPAYDWQWMNHYFYKYIGSNPFGFSARRIGDIHSGLCKDYKAATSWKKYRKTKHTHDPVDDAKGNAEAILVFNEKFGFNAPV